MGRMAGIFLIVAGALLLVPFPLWPLYAYFHHYYTVGLTIDSRGYLVLSVLFLLGSALLIWGIRILAIRRLP